MRLIDLFSGIGGFSLAAHWMGWETIAFCEQDKFCQKVLRKNFDPSIPIYDDVRTFPGESFRGADIVTGGFPCQPFSAAGRQQGIEDERHLWPEMLRVIREIQPRWVVGENVLGLVNWSGGLVFDEVQADLETEGFQIAPFLLPACAKDAPHRRDRIWFVAHTEQGLRASSGLPYPVYAQVMEPRWSSNQDNPPLSSKWLHHQTDRRTLRNDDGFSEAVDRIGALGNSIVPQIAYEIFRAIERAEVDTRTAPSR